jgi:hypothetical protein
MQRLTLYMFVTFGLALGLSLVFDSRVGIYVAATFVLVCPIVYARVVGRRRVPSAGLYWRGYVSFEEASLENVPSFPNIHRHERIGRRGRRRHSSGRCELRDDGISWQSGGWATPLSAISGVFHLPWSAIDGVDVYRLPGKLPGVGGGVNLRLTANRGAIRGEFIGSLRGMSEAVELLGRSALR